MEKDFPSSGFQIKFTYASMALDGFDRIKIIYCFVILSFIPAWWECKQIKGIKHLILIPFHIYLISTTIDKSMISFLFRSMTVLINGYQIIRNWVCHLPWVKLFLLGNVRAKGKCSNFHNLYFLFTFLQTYMFSLFLQFTKWT